MRIMHLEDDGPLRDILATALKAVEPDCDLRQFINSDEAVDFIQANANQIDLFILDIRVPGTLNGLQVADKIREIDTNSSIVITSAYRVPGRDFLDKCRCEWIPKPWHIMETTRHLVSLANRKQSPSG